jgi:hypothetical protein
VKCVLLSTHCLVCLVVFNTDSSTVVSTLFSILIVYYVPDFFL